ncbi:MAG TPA: helix-turn-helix transcriptional regulator [Gammaproteobacteria bacterium]|nr:helix-turn-helix transcriptional regulator [Gammaproteobacteria bacterium]
MQNRNMEPRFARIAATIGDPTRARMLGALLDGSSRPAGEIARAAGITPATASGHLAKLVAEGLVSVRVQGRHRYYSVSGGDVAHALEALCVVADRAAPPDQWQRESHRPLKHARTCYRHLAGELGVQLFRSLVTRGRLVGSDDGYDLTPTGRAWLEEIGVACDPAARGGRYAYGCLDWSERRSHLAGRLATALLDHFLARRWLLRTPQSRALTVTPQGRRRLSALLD